MSPVDKVVARDIAGCPVDGRGAAAEGGGSAVELQDQRWGTVRSVRDAQNKMALAINKTIQRAVATCDGRIVQRQMPVNSLGRVRG
jgi:hypothetical protein